MVLVKGRSPGPSLLSLERHVVLGATGGPGVHLDLGDVVLLGPDSHHGELPGRADVGELVRVEAGRDGDFQFPDEDRVDGLGLPTATLLTERLLGQVTQEADARHGVPIAVLVVRLDPPEEVRPVLLHPSVEEGGEGPEPDATPDSGVHGALAEHPLGLGDSVPPGVARYREDVGTAGFLRKLLVDVRDGAADELHDGHVFLSCLLVETLRSRRCFLSIAGVSRLLRRHVVCGSGLSGRWLNHLSGSGLRALPLHVLQLFLHLRGVDLSSLERQQHALSCDAGAHHDRCQHEHGDAESEDVTQCHGGEPNGQPCKSQTCNNECHRARGFLILILIVEHSYSFQAEAA